MGEYASRRRAIIMFFRSFHKNPPKPRATSARVLLILILINTPIPNLLVEIIALQQATFH
jgi:hypothetical protein